MEQQAQDTNGNELTRRGSALDLVPQMVSTAAEMKARLVELQNFVKDVMVEGVDFGPPFPGSDKRVLLKGGAEKLAEIYGYAVEPTVVVRIEHWGPPLGPFFSYEIECRVYSKRSGMLIGKGLGSCNTKENRYRWRTAGRVCPECKKEGTVMKGKPEFERDPAFRGGFFCFGKKGGCGAKWKPGDPAIEDQEVGRVENDDVHTLVNTCLKIAKKRAYLDAVISVTQSSGLFTGEDDDDEVDGERHTGGKKDARRGNANGGGKKEGAEASGPKEVKGGKGPDDAHQTKVMIKGQEHWTAGVGSMKLIQVWDLARAYDAAVPDPKESHKVLMADVCGVTSSLDLNESMADEFIAVLKKALEEQGGTAKKTGTGDAYD